MFNVESNEKKNKNSAEEWHNGKMYAFLLEQTAKDGGGGGRNGLEQNSQYQQLSINTY